jgi:O-antigen/teichoic acid export membrane protein
MDIKSYLKKNVFASVGKILTVSSVTLLLLPIIIQKIGLDLYGIISLTLLFSGVSSLIDLGLSQAIVLLSGDKKITSNQVITSAVYINLTIISIISIVFVLLNFIGVDLLGENINLNSSEKYCLLITGFFILIFMLLNNLCKSILEANYFMHVVNFSLALFTPVLYLTIYILSFFTDNVLVYIITPLIITSILFVFYVVYIKMKTDIKLVKVGRKQIIYVLKCSLRFLNLGVINSVIMPVMRYLFILMVADVGMYAIFDLSFKVAMLANSLIVSLSVPMFAVFSKLIKEKAAEMSKIAFKIFYISLLVYVAIIVGYHFLGETILSYLRLTENNLDVLYNLIFILIVSIGSVAVVEVFYRYFLGDNQLKKAFLIKLSVPITSVIFFFLMSDIEIIYRFIYAYGLSLVISAIIIFFTFMIENNKLKKLNRC